MNDPDSKRVADWVKDAYKEIDDLEAKDIWVECLKSESLDNN